MPGAPSRAFVAAEHAGPFAGVSSFGYTQDSMERKTSRSSLPGSRAVDRRAGQPSAALNPRRRGCTLPGMGSGQGLKVFLSYAQSDGKWARELSEHLEAAGFEVFDPIGQLLPGDNWSLEIGKALDDSQAMVVLISPAAVQSSWVQREIQYALGSEKYQDRLIPVEVEPTTDFPWVLRHLQWIKGDPLEAGQRVAEILQSTGELDVHADAH
jgi:TIR domain